MVGNIALAAFVISCGLAILSLPFYIVESLMKKQDKLSAKLLFGSTTAGVLSLALILGLIYTGNLSNTSKGAGSLSGNDVYASAVKEGNDQSYQSDEDESGLFSFDIRGIFKKKSKDGSERAEDKMYYSNRTDGFGSTPVQTYKNPDNVDKDPPTKDYEVYHAEQEKIRKAAQKEYEIAYEKEEKRIAKQKAELEKKLAAEKKKAEEEAKKKEEEEKKKSEEEKNKSSKSVSENSANKKTVSENSATKK